MNFKKLWYLLFAIAVFASCEEDEEAPSLFHKEEISGFAQKGPFINGGAIEISELNAKLNATGKKFDTQIDDKSGSFSFSDVTLSSPYASLKAEGFYFNENQGENSSVPLTLYSLTELSEENTVNINVLTYLEKARTEFLFADGMDFETAKKQAQKEVLAIFEIEKEGIRNSEHLDISQAGDDHAILLAVSVILQGNRSVAELSELMANMITDMKVDGTLDNPDHGSALLNGIQNLDLSRVHKNVEEKYKSLGINTTSGDFIKYVVDFKNNTDFVKVSEFLYPEFGDSGLNVLYVEDDYILNSKQHPSSFSLSAAVPDNSSLRVVMKKIEGDWTFQHNPEQWEISGSSEEGMSEIRSLKSGELLNASLELSQKGSCLMEIYEGDNTEPSITKTLHWDPDFTFIYPEEGQYGPNLLALPNIPADSRLLAGEYSFAITLPDDKDYEVEIRIDEGVFENIRIDREKIQNWEYTPVDHGIILRVSGRGITADISFTLLDYGDMTIHSPENIEEIEKHIDWIDPSGLNGDEYRFKYPEEGEYGMNLFGYPDGVNQITPGEYSLAVFIPDFKDYKVEFKFHISAEGPVSIDPAKVKHWDYELKRDHTIWFSYEYDLILRYTGRGVIPDLAITLGKKGGIFTHNHQRQMNIYWE